GLWTSIALSPDDQPMVAYYDATNFALKFAFYDGNAWNSYAMKQAPQSDNGRYAKMIIVNGNPVVAFLTMEKGTTGRLRSKVVVARASTGVPKSAGDWTSEDAAVDENGPCRARYCDSGQKCIKETGVCQPTVTGCMPADCGGGGGIGSAAQACVTITGK